MKPEDVFRFVNVRSVQRAPEERVRVLFASYGDDTKSPFHLELSDVGADDARQVAAEMARVRLSREDSVGEKLAVLLPVVRMATTCETVTHAKKAVEQGLRVPLSAYLQSGEARALKDALWDRLYAHALVPEERPGDRELMREGVRAIHFLELLARQKENDSPLSWATLSTVKPTIPPDLVPAAPWGDTHHEEQIATEAIKQLEAIHRELIALEAAIEDLTRGDQVLQQRPRPVRALSAMQEAPARAERPRRSSARSRKSSRGAAGKSGALTRSTAADAVMTLARVEQIEKRAPWVWSELGEATLSEASRGILSKRQSNLAELEVPEMIAALEREKYELVAGYVRNLPAGALQYVGGTNAWRRLLEAVPIPGFDIAPFVVLAPEPGSAIGRGIKPLGIGDLMVVKQQLLRYAPGEVAHIENVLKSEHKTRTHTRVREVEEITVVETERFEESEKDLQTTERFELQREAQRTIEQQMSIEAGVSITAGYGPVSVTAHADFARSQSASESSRTASTFARQVINRSMERILQRTREERTRRTLERFEEKNEHGFDNRAGAGHVIGVYRWVDKFYEARLINYGRRLMIEFIVPEPATFYQHVTTGRPPKGITMEKPMEPKVSGRRLQSSDLNASNYDLFVSQYNVQDVEPYPAEVVRVSAAFAESTGTPDNSPYAKTSEKLTVPQGYQCYEIWGNSFYQGVSGSVAQGVSGSGKMYFMEVVIGGEIWGSVTGKGLTGIIPISVSGWFTAFQVNVKAVCKLTPEAKAAWQLKTYAAIMNAYERALATYNEQLAAAQIQGGVAIEGQNPELNRKIERDELKKGALRLLTNDFARTRVGGAWRFNEMFNAMRPGGKFGYPEFDVDEAMVEGRIVQFFEQAFEWENMTYRFYPYFWGYKGKWRQTFPLTDPDPQFTDFLRAGAARVIVPVHPPYNETMLHYMSTNEIWNGGDPPTLNDPLFISIADELRATSGADTDGELPACAPEVETPCLMDSWEVKLPTTLVYLQDDATLPDLTSQ